MVRTVAVLALGWIAMLTSGCDCGGGPRSCTSSSDCPRGQSCVDGSCGPAVDAAREDAGELDASFDGGACRSDTDCPGEACIGGACCMLERVCGGIACCAGTEVCFANACVVPGEECLTSADCGEGRYCEPALGEGASDAGVPDAGRACTGAAPSPGRCLDLPPRCPDADGGVADAGVCVSTCEYRPPVGRLSAEIAWSWGQPTPPADYPEHVDVWSTPAVGRVYDANCDGTVDVLDPPNVVFVSGRAIDATTGRGTCCHCTNTTPTGCKSGVLRVVDGRTGESLLSLRNASPGSGGFSGVSVAIGDVDRDGDVDIAAVTGEGDVVLIGGDGAILATSDVPIPGAANATFGWGGGLALADADHDGEVEIAYGATVYEFSGGTIVRRFTGTAFAGGGAVYQQLSTFADVDGAADGNLELVAGPTAYRVDGTTLWHRSDLEDGFPGVADLDGDGTPEVVVIANDRIQILDGATGASRATSLALPGNGFGGPPTIADFDGDGRPEVGVAQQNFYTVLDVDVATMTISVLWSSPNHDLSSSVTGSTVFDFEGDGIAEVVYHDECFVWVYDGPTGAVRFAGLTTSFTGTEASVVADVDGDGHAEILDIASGADPSAAGWACDVAPWNAEDTATGRPAWVGPAGTPGIGWRGVRMYRDPARSWVGTRPLWNQHTYHVTNICADGDTACDPPQHEGTIPMNERANWTLPWLDNFRQNVQEQGLFSAPDATLTLAVRCSAPLALVASVRNLGEALLPPGVEVAFYRRSAGGDVELARARTTGPLFPGRVEDVVVAAPIDAGPDDVFVARIVIDPLAPTFRECRDGNNESNEARIACLM